MIKAVFFDVGGVLLNAEPLLNKIINLFQPQDKKYFWERLNLWALPLCRGDIDDLQFWKDIAKDFGRQDIPDDVLKTLWIKDYGKLTSINNDVMSIAASLKHKYRLGIISNTLNAHRELNNKRRLYELFDVVILSHEVKMAKDNKDMFILAIKRMGVKPEECVFIDDIQDFVNTAGSVGMKAIHYKNPEQLKSDLRSFGVDI